MKKKLQKYSENIKSLFQSPNRSYETDCVLVLAFYQFLKAKAVVDMQGIAVSTDNGKKDEAASYDDEFIKSYVWEHHSNAKEQVARLARAKNLVCEDCYSDDCMASVMAVTKGTDMYLMIMEFGIVGNIGVGSEKTTMLKAAVDAMAGM